MKKQLNQKVEWYRMIGRGRNHAVLFIDSVGLANSKGYSKDIIGIDFRANHYRQFDGSRWISEKDHQVIDRLFYKKLKNDPEFLYRAGIKIEKNCSLLINFVNKYKNQKWINYSNGKIGFLFEKIHNLSAKIWGGPWAYGYYFYFNDIYLNEFKERLERKLKKDDFEKIWNFTLQPQNITFMGKERLVLLKIALKFLKNKKIPNSYISKHLDKFAFVGKYYFWGEGLNSKQINDEIKKIIKSGEKNINREIKGLKLIKLNLNKFPLTQYERRMIKSIKEISYAFNFTDEAYNYYTFYFKDFFQEIAKRLKISYEELVSMRLQEIRESLSDDKLSVTRKELKERYKDHALIFARNNVYVISGKDLEKYRKAELKERVQADVKEIKGTVAFKSNESIKGNVMVIKSDKQINSFKNGMILVAQMTNPTYLPAMKKSKVIITDEGGLLCHAAIVSRELSIPCIIGTKIATKVLRDGDLIEVDANNGVIKILKKNS